MNVQVRHHRIPENPWDLLGDSKPLSCAYLDAAGKEMSIRLVGEIGASSALAYHANMIIVYYRNELNIDRQIILLNTLNRLTEKGKVGE